MKSKRTMDCSQCNGYGHWFDKETKKKVICKNCNGKGYLKIVK